MRKICFFALVFGLAVLFLASPGRTLEKVRYGTSAGVHPFYAMPFFASEDKGVWTRLGLEVAMQPFPSGGVMYRAAAAGHLEAGSDSFVGMVHAASVGAPVAVAADMGMPLSWYIWVRTDGPIKEPKDLKGQKLGALRFGGVTHVFLMSIMEALGLSKDVKYVANGGLRETVAALRVGQIEATIVTEYAVLPVLLEGKVRKLVPLDPYLPKPWIDVMVWSEKGFAAKKKEVLRKVVTGIFEGAEIVLKDPDWAVAKMKSAIRLSDEVARRSYPFLAYRPTTKIDPKGIENVRNFLVKYRTVAEEKTPPVDELYLKW